MVTILLAENQRDTLFLMFNYFKPAIEFCKIDINDPDGLIFT